MNVDVIIIGCIVVLSALYALFNLFGGLGLSCGIAMILILVYHKQLTIPVILYHMFLFALKKKIMN